ncbi:MAG: hypothetical protein ACUVXF_08055 [Desulfobaccales bacterium]
MDMPWIFLWADPYLIWFFRLTGRAGVDFVLGTLAVAGIALLVGEFTSWGASLLVRRRLEEVTAEAKKYHELSLEALEAGDRLAYEAANQMANEVFSKSFFMQIALSATFFWPVFFFLGWMQHRFLEVEFPLPGTDWSLSYLGVFIIFYVLAYFLVRGVKRWWFFPRPQAPSSSEGVQSLEGKVLSSTRPAIKSYEQQ